MPHSLLLLLPTLLLVQPRPGHLMNGSPLTGSPLTGSPTTESPTTGAPLSDAGPHELIELPPSSLFEHPGEEPDGAVRIPAGERWTTAWLWPRRSFREVLPSWNVDCPDGAAFVVELQVAARPSIEASPWLHIGDWQAGEAAPELPPRGERRTAFPGGKVAVDVLEGDQPFQVARLRITATGGDVMVARLACVFSDMERFREPGRVSSRSEAGPLGELQLTCRHGSPLEPRRQGDASPELASRICSPTSVAQVVADLGEGQPTELVAGLAYDHAHDIYGNWNRAVQTAWTLGIPGRLECIDSWEQVAGILASGRRMVISLAAAEGALRGAPYTRTSGHLLVLWGLADDGRVLVNDPAAARLSEVPRAYLPQDLERTWMARGGVSYVFDPAP